MDDLSKKLEDIRIARHGAKICKALQNACIGIAGLGGLGSNIALSLARMGVGKLVLADFDHVDLSNIQRQQYNLSQVGRPKTEAMVETIAAVHPTCDIISHQVLIDENNAAEIFHDCQIVCEAFDDAHAKAMLVETLLSTRTNLDIIAASGMAGAKSANLIQTKKRMPRLYICGDEVSDINTDGHLYAARVAICANHQALMVLRLLNGEREP